MDKLNDTIGQFTADNLISSQELPIVVKGFVLKKAQGVVNRGTVLGVITASGLAVPVNSAAADGSQSPVGILTDTIDTTSAATDIKTTAYVTGMFNKNALVFGGTDDAADHEAKLNDMGIFLKTNISY